MVVAFTAGARGLLAHSEQVSKLQISSIRARRCIVGVYFCSQTSHIVASSSPIAGVLGFRTWPCGQQILPDLASSERCARWMAGGLVCWSSFFGRPTFLFGRLSVSVVVSAVVVALVRSVGGSANASRWMRRCHARDGEGGRRTGLQGSFVRLMWLWDDLTAPS